MKISNKTTLTVSDRAPQATASEQAPVVELQETPTTISGLRKQAQIAPERSTTMTTREALTWFKENRLPELFKGLEDLGGRPSLIPRHNYQTSRTNPDDLIILTSFSADGKADPYPLTISMQAIQKSASEFGIDWKPENHSAHHQNTAWKSLNLTSFEAILDKAKAYRLLVRSAELQDATTLAITQHATDLLAEMGYTVTRSSKVGQGEATLSPSVGIITELDTVRVDEQNTSVGVIAGVTTDVAPREALEAAQKALEGITGVKLPAVADSRLSAILHGEIPYGSNELVINRVEYAAWT